MAKKKRITFDEYYQSLYPNRWEELKKALLHEESLYFELKEGLRKSYFLDPASVEAANTLNVLPGESVLDLCAAPGGKSLLLALALKGEGRLVSNDISPSRRERLQKVLREHLNERDYSIVSVYGHDAARWGLYEKGLYDKILCDVPCSSERHVIKSPKHLAQWSESRIKTLATRQFAILASALDALKVGGTLIYSTCAITPKENDAVIEKLFKKRAGLFEVITEKNAKIRERTQYGIHILPDLCGGLGPIYYSCIKKLGDNNL